MTWTPLIEDADERAACLALAREIADAVSAHPDARADAGTECDLALLRTYLGYDDDGDDELVADALAGAVEQLPAATSPGLYGGVARVGWTVAHLVSGDDAETVVGAIDRSLTGLLDAGAFPHYDLISGTVGFGVYALERADTDGGRRLAARLVDELERTARPRGPGLAWFTPPEILPEWQRELAADGYWNLGLAHGVPGAIAVLARMVSAGIEPARSRALLDGAVAYLLDAEPPDERGRYPGWHPEGRPGEHHVRRAAWCYGDLGVAVALMHAAQATARADWHAEALALARASARCPAEDSGVVDMALCHGASGVAHLLGRLHQATGDVELGDAARAWVRRTIAARRDDAIAGFPSLTYRDGAKVWEPDASILTGATGVALALHAAASDVEPGWDRTLLVDLAPRDGA